MAKSKSTKRWVYSPPKAAKPAVPDALKAQVEAHAEALLASMREQFIKPPPEEPQFNYLIDLWCKWNRSYFYFGGTYACPGPNAISPSFDDNFARMEYIGNERFNLAYMRHTGKWHDLFMDLSLEDAFEALRTQPHFFPI